MRTGFSLPIAAGALALALLAPVTSAGAVTLPGASEMPVAAQGIGSVEQTRTVCRRNWNGHRWRQRCWWVGPHRYYGPPRYYYRHHHRNYRW